MISIEDCQEILRKKLRRKEVSVQEIQMISVPRDGFLGEYYSLLIDYESEDEEKLVREKLFVKTLPFHNIMKTERMLEVGFFKKEADFYSKIFTKMAKYSESRKWAPDFYESQDEFIVMEDLNLNGYYTMPFGAKFEFVHMETTLKTLAKMHASSIAFETLENFSIENNFGHILRELLIDPNNPFFVTGLKALKAIALEKSKFGRGTRHEKFVEEKFLEICSQIYEQQESAGGKVPKAVTHHDIWRTNIMLKFDKTESGKIDYKSPRHCVFVDFQQARYLPVTVDVILTIHYNLLNSQRLESESKYLKIYYEELKHQLLRDSIDLEDIMSYSDYLESIESLRLFALIMSGTYSTLTDVPPHIFQDLNDNHEAEYHKVTVEDRSDFILKQMEAFQELDEKLRRTVEELVQFMLDTCNE